MSVLFSDKGSFVFMKKKNTKFSCQDTQNDAKHPEKWFGKFFRMVVCGYIRSCVKTSKIPTVCISGITHKGTSRGVRLRFWWNWNMLKRIQKNEIRVLLSAEKRFKGVKTTPIVCTQKSFFFNISKNNYIFLVKPTPKYFL